jgi:clan AA aspartic protease (TIGR02281 family)
MMEAGARPGSLLFSGKTANGQYVGTAYVFDRHCGQFPYDVSGPILDNYTRVKLTGLAPRVGPYCQIEGYRKDTLEFTYLESGPSPPTPKPPAGRSIEVPLEKRGDIYEVQVEINGLALDFIIDSGATDVSVPLDVFSTLRRKGAIQDADIIGEQTYTGWDGSTQKTFTFTIRSLKVGNIVVKNVRGGVAPLQGSLLLGQSFLERFKSWSIDNTNHELLLEPR